MILLSMRHQWAYMTLGDDHAIQFVGMATSMSNSFVWLIPYLIVEVPGGYNANNYTPTLLMCRIAKEKGVGSVWPGWGHASEKPLLLPETLTKLGIKLFIGPTAPIMSVLYHR